MPQVLRSYAPAPRVTQEDSFRLALGLLTASAIAQAQLASLGPRHRKDRAGRRVVATDLREEARLVAVRSPRTTSRFERRPGALSAMPRASARPHSDRPQAAA